MRLGLTVLLPNALVTFGISVLARSNISARLGAPPSPTGATDSPTAAVRGKRLRNAALSLRRLFLGGWLPGDTPAPSPAGLAAFLPATLVASAFFLTGRAVEADLAGHGELRPRRSRNPDWGGRCYSLPFSCLLFPLADPRFTRNSRGFSGGPLHCARDGGHAFRRVGPLLPGRGQLRRVRHGTQGPHARARRGGRRPRCGGLRRLWTSRLNGRRQFPFPPLLAFLARMGADVGAATTTPSSGAGASPSRPSRAPRRPSSPRRDWTES